MWYGLVRCGEVRRSVPFAGGRDADGGEGEPWGWACEGEREWEGNVMGYQGTIKYSYLLLPTLPITYVVHVRRGRDETRRGCSHLALGNGTGMYCNAMQEIDTPPRRPTERRTERTNGRASQPSAHARISAPPCSRRCWSRRANKLRARAYLFIS